MRLPKCTEHPSRKLGCSAGSGVGSGGLNKVASTCDPSRCMSLLLPCSEQPEVDSLYRL